MAESKSCVFCRRPGNITFEHIWGDWTKRVVPRTSNKHTEARVTVMSPGNPDPAEVRIRAGDTLDASVPVACGECNSGWMSEIQNRAKPYLIPLINTELCVLDHYAQSIIAAWIAMASMTGEYVSKSDERIGVRQCDRDWLKDTQTAPSNWKIWIGRHRPVSSDMRWVHVVGTILDADVLPATLSDADRRPNTQTTSFTIGELYFFAMSTPYPAIANTWNWRTARRARGRLVQIWPHTSMGIFWPMPLMTDADAASFGTAVARDFDERAIRFGHV